MTTAQAFAGPDESHTISKMTATKVECQELNTDGGGVEEIATYSYSVQEESVQKPQNGVLIEEFSESSEQDNRSRLQVNRGVSIVSVSDDESTMKAISRDISAEDVHRYAELSEDPKLANGSYEELNGNGSPIEEKILSDKPHRACLITETIAEERSLEESVRSNQRNGDALRNKSSVDSEGSRMSPTIEDTIKLTKRKIERVNSISTAEKVVEINLEERRASVQNGISRQSSRIERTEDFSSVEARKMLGKSEETESKDGFDGKEEVDEELEALLDRVKRQRSVLDDILEKEQSRDNTLGKEPSKADFFEKEPSKADFLEKESSKADILEKESPEESGTIAPSTAKNESVLAGSKIDDIIPRVL